MMVLFCLFSGKLVTFSWLVFVLLQLGHCGDDEQYAIADPATLWDILKEGTQQVLKENYEELKHWQPYGDVEDGLLSPEAAAVQRKWHEYNQMISSQGNIDSARLLVSFGMMPVLTSSGNALHEAATLGEYEKVVSILEDPNNSIEVDSEKSDGSTTALLIAAIMGHDNIVEYLLSNHSAYTEAISQNGATALHFASALNHTNIVRLLIEHKADIDFPHRFAKSTALHFAVEMENIEIIELLCKHGANAEAEKINGGRPIHVASDVNATKSMKALIEYCNVDLESQLVNDTTALYLAAQYGFTQLCEILIDAGAVVDYVMPAVARRDLQLHNNMYDFGGQFGYGDKNVEMGNGATPLHAASENGHIDVVKLLLDRGSRQLASMEGADPLYVATEYNRYEIAKLLIKHGANVNHQVKGSDKMSALHWAAMHGNFKFVKLLLESNANPNMRLKSNGVTPLYWACSRKYGAIVNELLKYKADPWIVNKDDSSNALHVSVHYQCLECIQMLLYYDINLLFSKGPDMQNILHLMIPVKQGSRARQQQQSSNQFKQMEKQLTYQNYKSKKKEIKMSKLIKQSKMTLSSQGNTISLEIIDFILNFIKKNVISSDDKSKLINARIKSSGATVLFLAVQSGYYDIVYNLIDLFKYEIKINAKGNKSKLYGATPLFLSVQQRDLAILDLLIKNDAKINDHLFEYKSTSLHIACERNYFEIALRLLMEYKESDESNRNNIMESVEAINEQGLTPVHIACQKGFVDIVELIVDITGASIATQDSSGNTRMLSQTEVVQFCIQIYSKRGAVPQG